MKTQMNSTTEQKYKKLQRGGALLKIVFRKRFSTKKKNKWQRRFSVVALCFKLLSRV